jgi:hypothetical protein
MQVWQHPIRWALQGVRVARGEAMKEQIEVANNCCSILAPLLAAHRLCTLVLSRCPIFNLLGMKLRLYVPPAIATWIQNMEQGNEGHV